MNRIFPRTGFTFAFVMVFWVGITSYAGEQLRDGTSDKKKEAGKEKPLELNIRILRAIFHGKPSDLTKILDSGADVNMPLTTSGLNGLTIAAMEGKVAFVRIFLARGADVNGTESSRPIMIASLRSRTEIAELLIQKGAKVNAQDNKGFTALHGVQDLKLANLLINNGADVNAKSKSAFSPLHIAALAGKKEIISLLVKHGADLNAKNKDGKTPLEVSKDDEIRILITTLASPKENPPESGK